LLLAAPRYTIRAVTTVSDIAMQRVSVTTALFILFAIELFAVAGCAMRSTVRAIAPDGAAPLTPGSQLLDPPSLRAGESSVAVSMKRPVGDTTERQFGAIAATETIPESCASDASCAMLTRAWPKPFTTLDTLIVDQRSLAPRDEALSASGSRYRYHFDGGRVTGTVTRADSARQVFDHDFGEPVFAFNEVEVLVRSLRFRQGLRVIAPLFSEIDRALERDTLTVLKLQTMPDGSGRWIVRFADPAVTTRYVVDAGSRNIVDAVTTQRASRVEFRYRYGSAKTVR
jgi:hypothetical protein